MTEVIIPAVGEVLKVNEVYVHDLDSNRIKLPHDYKYAVAVMDDYKAMAPQWRDRYLAASAFYLRGSGDSDAGGMTHGPRTGARRERR